MSAKITLTKKSYSWGERRVLRKGNDYTCVIHPEHLEAINEEMPFTDEQGYCWKPVIIPISTINLANIGKLASAIAALKPAWRLNASTITVKLFTVIGITDGIVTLTHDNSRFTIPLAELNA